MSNVPGQPGGPLPYPLPDTPNIPEASPGQQVAHDELMQFFAYAHLPPHLQEVSKVFHDMAEWMLRALPFNRERSAGLRKLLEAKDCAVRARLFKR